MLLAVDIVKAGIREFVNYGDGPEFLERDLDRIGCEWVPVGQSS